MTAVSELDRGAVVRMLTEQGFNADPAAVERLRAMPDPAAAIERTVASVGAGTVKITAADVPDPPPAGEDPPVSGGNADTRSPPSGGASEGSSAPDAGVRSVTITGDVTGRSTGTGTYEDFVALFRDRFEQLSGILDGRVQHRSIRSLRDARGGLSVGLIGMVNDIRSTRNGHWLIELEDETGVFPALVMKDRDDADAVAELLTDEVVGVEGTLSDDAEILFADSLVFPDVPRTRTPHTADRAVEAALISDVHVGSAEFLRDAWRAFADWLHTDEASAIEYLVIAGDMVEGVGVYPGQDADLDVVDIYDQYEAFSEELKAVPGDLDVVMIPGNHDAVRRAEPQPAFEDEIADILGVHDPHVTSNPSTVDLEGVRLLLYHGASLDELIAELPDPVSYEHPEEGMARLLRKRHLAPSYGGSLRIAPEERDYLVIDEVPDVFHAGHTHTFGVTSYRGVRVVNTGCWQDQTDFQRRNNLDPDPGRAVILGLDTLELTVRKFV